VRKNYQRKERKSNHKFEVVGGQELLDLEAAKKYRRKSGRETTSTKTDSSPLEPHTSPRSCRACS
jgi:hypothetical protein